jgi:hypothetical protein
MGDLPSAELSPWLSPDEWPPYGILICDAPSLEILRRVWMACSESQRAQFLRENMGGAMYAEAGMHGSIRVVHRSGRKTTKLIVEKYYDKRRTRGIPPPKSWALPGARKIDEARAILDEATADGIEWLEGQPPALDTIRRHFPG